MERIVFNQQELDAVGAEVKSVALCDNDYVIRPVHGREYLAIGTVSAVVGCSAIEAVAMGLVFIGFSPVFDGGCVCAPVAEEVSCAPSSFRGSFTSSFGSSFSSSFKGSFTSSFKSSFSSSFKGSFATSFSGHYEYEYEYTSFRRGSFSGSFSGGSMRLSTSFSLGSMRVRKRPVVREIAVNGYGLNLI